jgi:hypothetical protein
MTAHKKMEYGQLPAERSRMAAFCMQQGTIAGIAQQMREQGDPKERAYAQFTGMGDSPREIIDKVYAGTAPRPRAIMDAWADCIAPISDDH